MTEAQKIQSLIESVSPDDEVVLDEIDARVWCYLNKHLLDPTPKFHQFEDRPGRIKYYTTTKNELDVIPKIQYTRSRDALKAIRPDGYCINIVVGKDGSAWAYRDLADRLALHDFVNEELAELHAIIQAIEYERTT